MKLSSRWWQYVATILVVAGTAAAQPPPEQPPPEPALTLPDEPVPPVPITLPLAAPSLGSDELPPEAQVAPRPVITRNFAGSIQLDYMAIPTRKTGREIALDGASAEVSLKLAIDFSGPLSANVKLCLACHGVEAGMAFFDLRVADELNFRVGRFTPSFGEFPVRHDPANHRTSDKPLPYDMGRMLRSDDWNEGVLPAPWVDNGIEINGTHFFGKHFQVDYAAYAIGGPRAGAEPFDFEYKRSRSGESYYIDNNSRPVLGGQIVMSLLAGATSVMVGASIMRGTYDDKHRLPFSLMGAHAVVRIDQVFLRLEYLTRRTRMALGEDPTTRFRYGPGMSGALDPHFVKDGGVAELDFAVTRRLALILREDGLRRRGNVATSSTLRKDSALLRHTAGLAFLLGASLRLKLNYEYYDFSDFDDESVVHVSIAGPF